MQYTTRPTGRWTTTAPPPTDGDAPVPANPPPTSDEGATWAAWLARASGQPRWGLTQPADGEAPPRHSGVPYPDDARPPTYPPVEPPSPAGWHHAQADDARLQPTWPAARAPITWGGLASGPGADRTDAGSLGQLTLAGPPRRPRAQSARASRAGVMGTALLTFGLLFLLGAVGMLVYGPWHEQEHLAERPAGPREDLPARWEPPAADGADPDLHLATAKSVGEGPDWMSIPRIDVDAPVMEMGLQAGEYQVPAWDVGHHADSANPGQPGNSVYNGHLETIDAGNVFARLHELRPGDLVYVYTGTYRFDWVVERTQTVRNDERAFLQPTSEPRLTLYTCAGSFDLRTHDYTHRLVVVGRLTQVVPRTNPAGAHS